MIALALLAATAPLHADAAPARIYRSHDVSGALAAGCTVQQVHTPAGKIGNHAAIIRCPAGALAQARAARRGG
jgi:hypothetical protein